MQKTTENPTALLSATTNCPCLSGERYQHCCQPLHQFLRFPATAEQLMRSRYTAYVLQNIDYIVKTTAPSQQAVLNVAALQQWAETTSWLGLRIKTHIPHLTPIHSIVSFEATFASPQGAQSHYEDSLFVNIDQRWYFVDPTVPLPTLKQPCLCGSGKKFKHCCGAYL